MTPSLAGSKYVLYGMLTEGNRSDKKSLPPIAYGNCNFSTTTIWPML
jgi:hypothetical protein